MSAGGVLQREAMTPRANCTSRSPLLPRPHIRCARGQFLHRTANRTPFFPQIPLPCTLRSDAGPGHGCRRCCRPPLRPRPHPLLAAQRLLPSSVRPSLLQCRTFNGDPSAPTPAVSSTALSMASMPMAPYPGESRFHERIPLGSHFFEIFFAAYLHRGDQASTRGSAFWSFLEQPPLTPLLLISFLHDELTCASIKSSNIRYAASMVTME